jgi:type IV secretion system protein VirB9
MRNVWAIVAAFMMVPASALAQQAVPAINPNELPPPIPLLSNKVVPLGAKAAAGLRISQAWAGSHNLPTPGSNGAVQFRYGATLPTLVCAPLRVCDIRLQPGEVVQQINIGDSAEWQAIPAVSGDGSDAVTHVLIKPVNSGLSTDLVISTNRRTYTIQLISDRQRWMPVVAFQYPSDVQAAWAAYHAKMDQEQTDNVLPSGQSVAKLDFNYRLNGANPDWRPVRVYTDGTKTYIDFPDKMLVTTAPVLLALGSNGKTELVNYRVDGSVYIVDRVLTRAELIAGVGSGQRAVRIRYTGRRF